MTFTRKRWLALALIVAAPVAATLGLTAYFEWSRSQPYQKRHDPIEDDPDLQPILQAAEKQAKEELKGEPQELGFIHRYWSVKRRILKDKHGIDWRTPAEMNPNLAIE
jgi:hypothetical protein